ncbi:MAG: SpoIIE family protein phosphatase [Treponema sp.]|nr:SpoIIE family protein phosphatase [Treponema sp.]
MPFLRKSAALPAGFGTECSLGEVPKVRSKIIVFSLVLFLVVFSLGSIAFIALMGRFVLINTGNELMNTLEIKRLRLEAYVNSEIAIVLKMSDSPLIKRYFVNPEDPELEKLAFEEFSAYRRAFAANSVFWINDTDKMFYSDDIEPFPLDPLNPDNYWYPMTLNETDVYNFNINYNPNLGVTNLWINAPVFDDDKKKTGIVGTGIYLSDFINTLYEDYSGIANVYYFNTAYEITGAKDIRLVAEKVSIKDELSKYWEEISAGMNELEYGGIKFLETRATRGVAVICEIPALAWYITAVQHISIFESLKTGMTVLFVALMIVMMIVVISIYAANESRLAKGRAEAAREAVITSIEYASKIQRNLLPSDSFFKEAFSDYSIIWKPRDIVGGDIYWIKNFDDGTLLCVCDCTGHGTPGALLTMLVVSTFESAVTENNYKNPSHIIWELEKRLVTVLNVKTESEGDGSFTVRDGCDLAVLFIARDGSISFSSGHIHIFVCDGKNVTRIKGQRINVGEGKIKNRDEINTVNIPVNPDNKFYIASDGLFDQPGGKESSPFGYNTFMRLILENHNDDHSVISEKIWAAFEEFRGNTPRVDDFELIGFKLKNNYI